MERTLSWLLPLLLLTACAGQTPPARFHVLAATVPPAPVQRHQPVLALAPVRLPDYLDRAQLVRRIGPTTLKVDEFERWGGDLGADLQRVLGEDLARLLGSDGVILLPTDTALRPDQRLGIEVLRFEGDDQGQVVLQVQWRLIDAREERLLALGRERIQVPMEGAGAPAQVAAMSRAVAELARRLAAILSKPAAMQSP